MARMKLGTFIGATLCLFASVAHATPSPSEQAAARSRARDHAGAIELYRQAYELDSDPALLVRIAHEHRLAGDARQALAYFCSYMYVDAAGELADEASANARALAARLGNPAHSDHDACATKPAGSRPAPPPTVDTLATSVPARPPRITKREVAGLVTLGGSVASLGLALLEARRIQNLGEQIDANSPGTDLAVLEDRKDSAALRQKVFLVAGGATLITGGILYVTGRADRKRAERAYVAPSLTKNGGALVLGGRF